MGQGEIRNQTIQEILERWPHAAKVFLKYGMACVGCVMAPFETLAEALAAYRISLERFLADLASSPDQRDKPHS